MKSFEEVHALLSQHVPSTSQFKRAYTLDTMRDMMAALGNPQDNYKTIHVAGTSGKTSTAYYIAALLKETGTTIGLTVSPHIEEVNERVQIDLVPLPEHEFCSEFTRFIKTINKLSINPTYYELLVGFAFWQFAQQKVDYAVIEVGLGGLLDGTNVISRKDKICVITDIGLDHVNILGNSLGEIAAQKAGIIHADNQVFMYEQQPNIMHEVAKQVSEVGATLSRVQDQSLVDPEQLPLFQQRNWSLAKYVADFLCTRDNLGTLTQSRLSTTKHTIIPARMEQIKVGKNRVMILDGAHNEQKMKALVQSFEKQYTGKTAVLVALVADKELDVKAILTRLRSIASHVIITSYKSQQDLHKMGIDPIWLESAARAVGIDSIEVVVNPYKAYEQLVSRPEKTLLVTGSFYLLNHIRPLAKKGFK